MRPDESPRDHTRHSYEVYGPVPMTRCRCVICIHARMVRSYCPACHNGGGLSGCWVCGRGTYWTESATTDDAALGA
jgi:hypothetical protein